MTLPTFLQMADSIRVVIREKIDIEFQKFRGEIDQLLKGFIQRIDDIQLLPGPQGPAGPAGRDGEKGQDGRDGKDGTAGIPGERGEPGRPGEIGPIGPIGFSGKDGKDGERGPAGIPGAVGPKGLDGIDGKDGPKGDKGDPGVAGKDGRDGRDGKEGTPGRDALSLEILSMIDPAKSYPRGTFAAHRGGLLHANRNTDPMAEGQASTAGWDVLVNGIADVHFTAQTARNFWMELQSTDGKICVKEFTVPAMVYQGIYERGASYEQGDVVTFNGSGWHAMQTPARGVPGEANSDWQLIVKHGRDGKDGKNGQAGPAGPRGRDAVAELKERFDS